MQFIEMVDHDLGRRFGHGLSRIAEAYHHHRHRSGLGGHEVDAAIADHDGAGGVAAGEAYGPGQMERALSVFWCFAAPPHPCNSPVFWHFDQHRLESLAAFGAQLWVQLSAAQRALCGPPRQP